MDTYKDDLAEYRAKKKALTDLAREIGRTIAKHYIPLLKGKHSAHEQLIALKEQITPTAATRAREYEAKY